MKESVSTKFMYKTLLDIQDILLECDLNIDNFMDIARLCAVLEQNICDIDSGMKISRDLLEVIQ